MDREETKEILKIITSIYPGFYRDAGRDSKIAALDLWASIFAEEPFGLVAAALKAFIVSDTKGFAPVPGQVKEKIRLIMQPKEMTEQEAWQLVYKAIKNSGYAENARAEYEKLPDVIRSIVTPAQLREWALADAGSIQTVTASNFMRSFRQRQKQVADYMALPPDVRQAVEGFAGAEKLKGESIC